MKNLWKVIGNGVFYLILISLIFLSLSVLNAKRLGKQPEILGYKFYTVLTGSMTPTIKVGDLVIVKDISPKDIKVGDIITFRSERSNNVTTHRVKDIINQNELEFVTKGDANNTKDPEPIKENLLVGKAVKVIPKMGKVTEFMKNNIIVIIGSIVVIAFIVGAAFSIKKKQIK